MINEEQLKEQYIDHEVRIRLLEKLCRDTHSLLRWTFGTILVSVVIPLILRLFGFN